MTSGPAHFAEAERLLAAAGTPNEYCMATFVAAQVHATLALVAATVGNAEQDFDKVDEHVTAWAGVLA